MLGNGDSTYIQTPSGKNILIDTGEAENTVVEYLLDRNVKKIDFLLISHFDSDHSEKAVEIIEKLNVKNLIISKQSKSSEQFEKTMKAAKLKGVNLIQVQAGETLKIEKDIYLEILWPSLDEMLTENPLNNNSIVVKMKYKDISILFTGDIEKVAEKAILTKYKNNNTLQSTILKVPHHGSKTSTTEEFLEAIEPRIALIGVGENNKFGHPNDEIIHRIENMNCRIYRTDMHGEITIEITKKGKLKISTFIE